MIGLGKGGLLLKYGYFWYLCWVVPCPAIVTTRIIICLIGETSVNLHLPLLLGGGTTQYLC